MKAFKILFSVILVLAYLIANILFWFVGFISKLVR